jgi:DNA polymerase elongation subunit (family B)
MTYISAQVTENRKSVIVWERDEQGDRTYKTFNAPYYFYYPDEHGKFLDIHGNKLSRLDCDTYGEFYKAKEEFKLRGVRLYESDIGPEFKILSEHYYNKPSGRLNITFLDIEVNYDITIGHAKPSNPYAPISAIALYHQYNDTFVTYVVPPTPDWTEEKIWEEFASDPKKYAYEPSMRDRMSIIICKDEAQLLKYFLVEIENTDILSGWNSSWFDCPYIYFRLVKVLGQHAANRLSFPNAKPPRIKEVEKFNRKQLTVEFNGRISLDYLELFVKLEQEKRPSNTLEAISEELLPDMKKLEYEGSLHDLYYNNFAFFCRYNIRDTEILKGFEEKLKYAQFSVNFSHAATGLPNNVLGTIKLTELAIINYCHYELDTIVPDSKENTSGGSYLGAFVLDPQVGLHDWVSGIDVQSLYPSTMRALNISPEAIIGQFNERNKAYEAFFGNSNTTRLTMVYENGVAESNTVEEWKETFESNKWSISGYGTVFSQTKRGFITDILTDWFFKRIEYKGKMSEFSAKLKTLEKGSIEYNQTLEDIDYYDKLQYIMKIRLNSIYGCMGNEFFKFYDVRMAESVTRSGREVLMHMVRKTSELLDGEYIWPSASALYSDTDSVYFTTHAENADEALIIAKDVCKRVNVSFKPFMQNAFMCTDGFDGLIKAEQEMVAEKAIFISKKYYILKIVNNNGKAVNKIKIMGHQVKKTTLPKHIRQRLIPYIEQIMNGAEWNDIGKGLVAYKDELMQCKILDIGAPIGINEFEKYNAEYAVDPKTRMPGHIAGAIFYNSCLEKHNDKVSPQINSGMKIKTFKLLKEFGRFKGIAVPYDTKELPAWFMEEFGHLIDKKGQVEKLVDKTMQNILTAIGKKMPTKKSLLVDELVEY